jgi:ABC-type protease/lipase transport system fused ATPase/permease subunit
VITWATLIADVRAQIAVDDDTAYAWLLDRARVLNGAAKWLLREHTTLTVTDQIEYPTPADALGIEAVTIGGRPYRRSTLTQMDAAAAGGSTSPIYADGVDEAGSALVAIWPPASGGVSMVQRYLADVPDERTGAPPFPSDICSALADGAIATGLARMDERFDSAGYFDARFADAIARCRLRRHSHIGRGGVPIRLVT